METGPLSPDEGENKNEENISSFLYNEHKGTESFKCYGYTFTGRRKNNEDAILVTANMGMASTEIKPPCYEINLPPGYAIFAVADGMGGAIAGELASRLAICTFRDYFSEKLSSDDNLPAERLKDMLYESLVEVQRVIAADIQKDPSHTGMGTTMVILLFAKDKCIWANIGDSRLYRIINDSIELKTVDHTYLNQYLNTPGKEPPDEDWMARYSSYLTRALDGTLSTPDIYPLEKKDSWESLSEDQCFLLCSDGLLPGKSKSGELPEIQIIKHSEDLKEAAEQLAWNSYKKGSTDNISVILIKGPKYEHQPPLEKKLINPLSEIPETSLHQKSIGQKLLAMYRHPNLRVLIPLVSGLSICLVLMIIYFVFNSSNVGIRIKNQENISPDVMESKTAKSRPASSKINSMSGANSENHINKESFKEWDAFKFDSYGGPISLDKENATPLVWEKHPNNEVKSYNVLIYGTPSKALIDSITTTKTSIEFRQFGNLEGGKTYKATVKAKTINGEYFSASDSQEFKTVKR